MNDKNTPALNLKGIDLHYGYVKALDGVNFHVNQGEAVALLGDNGAGKSTLLKLMSGVHKQTHGTIRVHGNEVHFHSPKDSAKATLRRYSNLSNTNKPCAEISKSPRIRPMGILRFTTSISI